MVKAYLAGCFVLRNLILSYLVFAIQMLPLAMFLDFSLTCIVCIYRRTTDVLRSISVS